MPGNRRPLLFSSRHGEPALNRMPGAMFRQAVCPAGAAVQFALRSPLIPREPRLPRRTQRSALRAGRFGSKSFSCARVITPVFQVGRGAGRARTADCCLLLPAHATRCQGLTRFVTKKMLTGAWERFQVTKKQISKLTTKSRRHEGGRKFSVNEDWIPSGQPAFAALRRGPSWIERRRRYRN